MTLSNRQFPMLRMFATEGPDFYMTIDTARQFDQRPFRSMLMREYLTYVPSRGFRITAKGRDAWRDFEMTEIVRKNPLGELTAYFDPANYRRRKAS